jgi:hypothetical protein
VLLAFTFKGVDGAAWRSLTWTVRANDTVTLAPEASVTVTFTVVPPANVGVPEISPVEEPIESPAGSPVAE